MRAGEPSDKENYTRYEQEGLNIYVDTLFVGSTIDILFPGEEGLSVKIS